MDKSCNNNFKKDVFFYLISKAAEIIPETVIYTKIRKLSLIYYIFKVLGKNGYSIDIRKVFINEIILRKRLTFRSSVWNLEDKLTASMKCPV